MKTLISTFLPFRLSFPSFPPSFPLFSCLVSPHFQSGFPSFPLGYFTFSCPPSNKPSNSQSALTPSLCLNPFGNHLRYHHRLFPIVPIHRRLLLLHRRHLSQPNPFPSRPPSSSAALFRRFSEGPGAPTYFFDRFVLQTPYSQVGVRSTKRHSTVLPAPGPSGEGKRGGTTTRLNGREEGRKEGRARDRRG